MEDRIGEGIVMEHVICMRVLRGGVLYSSYLKEDFASASCWGYLGVGKNVWVYPDVCVCIEDM